jgi:hypothetical protein
LEGGESFIVGGLLLLRSAAADSVKFRLGGSDNIYTTESSMLKHILIGTMVILAGSVIAANAEPKDDVTDAVKKLADGGNYTWTSTVETARGTNTTKGKTDKTDGTFFTQTRGDTSTDVAVLNGKAAVKTDDGWKTAEDAAAGGMRGMVGMLRAYKTPADQAATYVDKIDNIQKTDDGYSADLTPELVKLLAAFGRRGGTGAAAPEITDPKGSIKIWIKDGVISKTVMTVQGSMSIAGNDVPIDRTTTTEYSDVGSTKVQIPDEAKALLTAPPATAPAPAPAPM